MDSNLYLAMDNLTTQEAQKIAEAIRNGKNFYFEEYQGNGEGIFFKEGFFQVEHYHFEFHEYKKEIVYSNQLDERQVVAYLLQKPKHYFYDFLKD